MRAQVISIVTFLLSLLLPRTNGENEWQMFQCTWFCFFIFWRGNDRWCLMSGWAFQYWTWGRCDLETMLWGEKGQFASWMARSPVLLLAPLNHSWFRDLNPFHAIWSQFSSDCKHHPFSTYAQRLRYYYTFEIICRRLEVSHTVGVFSLFMTANLSPKVDGWPNVVSYKEGC